MAKKKTGNPGINLDDLIQEIYETEAPDLPGFLDQEQQKRIESKILAQIMEVDAISESKLGLEENGNVKKIPVVRKKKKRWLILALAAVLLLGLCLGTFARREENWDQNMLEFIGLGKEDHLELESGEVKLEVYDVSWAKEYKDAKQTAEKVVRMQAETSLGDKNSACVRIGTDYDVPDDFDAEKDYILPENSEIHVYENPEKKVETMKGTILGSYLENGKVGFFVYLTGCKDLNQSYVSMSFQNLVRYRAQDGEEEKELLLDASWDLQWKYDYKSSTEQDTMLKKIKVDGINYYITKVEISPLSVKVEGFRMPWNRKVSYESFKIDEIRYQDGTVLKVGEFSSAGCKNGMQMDLFLGTPQMQTTIQVEKLKSIVIGGNEIKIK